MTKYFLSNGAEPFGPFTTQQLADMGVVPETAVRREDQEAWTNAGDDPELAAALHHVSSAPSDAPSARGAEARAKPIHWGLPFKDDGPIGSGLRKYSAILWDVPNGQDWEVACYAMPATINGHFFQRPARCVHSGFNMWGEWHVPDWALDGFNAIVFLIPNIPAEAGHVGWGFKRGDGSWCWGATENAGLPPIIPAPLPNGVFVETGSKDEMLRAFRDGYRKSGGGKPWAYQRMKLLRASNPFPQVAEAAGRALALCGYNFFGNNCMDHTVRIINLYAGYPIVPIPALSGPESWFPRQWFDKIAGQVKPVTDGF